MNTVSIYEKQYVASFDVDAQYAFTPVCPDELPIPEGHKIVSELNAQAKLARLRIGAKDAHSNQALWIANNEHPMGAKIDAANMDMRWKAHAVPGTKGFAWLEGLPKITDYDYFVWKGIELDMHPYGGCYHDLAEKMSTGVIEYLRAESIKTIILGGLALDYCVKVTALQLSRAHFEVIINLAACRGIAQSSIIEAKNELIEAGVFLADSAAHIVNNARLVPEL